MSGPVRYLVDTNILLRFLSGEPVDQAAAARNLFIQAGQGKLVLDISPVIVAEAMYTLISFYRLDRKTAAEKLSVLLQQRGVALRDGTHVLSALERLQTANVAFADAFLAAAAAEEAVSVVSFDRGFDKFKDVARYEPKG